ncbi:MAG TPA: HEAT repeat domain-containing protein [Vicinamibacterales bacterium]
MRRVLPFLVAIACAAGVHAQQLSFEQVVAQLKAPEAAARMDALRLLEESGYPEAGGPIAALLKDPDERVMRRAVYAELGLYTGSRIEPKKRVAMVVEVRDSRPAARAFDTGGWSALPIAPVPPEIVSGLLAAAQSPDVAFRLEVLYALGILAQVDGTPPLPSHREVVNAMVEGLGDPASAVRATTARVAGRIFRRCTAPCAGIGIERLGDALVHVLNDSEAGVRVSAMEALGDLRWERGVQALTTSYEYYKKGNDALAALATLAQIGHPSSLPLFQSVMARNDDDLRREAIEGIGRTGDTTAVAALEPLLASERSVPLQLAVAFALHRAGRGSHIDVLVQAVGTRVNRLQAQDYLVELGPAAAGPVAAALQSETLHADSPEARIALIEVLSAVGGTAQVPAIDILRSDKNARLASVAERTSLRLKARQ